MPCLDSLSKIEHYRIFNVFVIKLTLFYSATLSGKHSPILPSQIATGSIIIFPPRGESHVMEL